MLVKRADNRLEEPFETEVYMEKVVCEDDPRDPEDDEDEEQLFLCSTHRRAYRIPGKEVWWRQNSGVVKQHHLTINWTGDGSSNIEN